MLNVPSYKAIHKVMVMWTSHYLAGGPGRPISLRHPSRVSLLTNKPNGNQAAKLRQPCKRRGERHTAEAGCMPLRRCPRRLPTPIRHDRPLPWTPLMPVRKRVNLLNTRTLCFGSNPRSNTYNRSQSSHTPQTLFRCRRTHHSTPRPLADHPQPSPQYSVYSSSASASPLSSASPFVSPYSPV
jgi:hypothetical protein